MKKALLIGNTKFVDPNILPLAAPRSDIEELKGVLEDEAVGSFDSVVCKFNIGLEDFQVSVSDLFRKAKRDDLIVFYYAGHGLRDTRGRLYLALPKTRSDAIWATALKTKYILEQMKETKSEKVVIILDCCHAGAVVKDGDFFLSRAAVDDGILDDSFIPKGKGTYVLAACQPGEKAYERKGGASVYTRTFIDAIKAGKAAPEKANLTVNDIHNYIDEQRLHNDELDAPNPFTEPLMISNQTKALEFCRNPNVQTPIEPALLSALTDENYTTRIGAVTQLIDQFSDIDLVRTAKIKTILEEHIAIEFDKRVENLILKALNKEVLEPPSLGGGNHLAPPPPISPADDRIAFIEKKLKNMQTSKMASSLILLAISTLPLVLYFNLRPDKHPTTTEIPIASETFEAETPTSEPFNINNPTSGDTVSDMDSNLFEGLQVVQETTNLTATLLKEFNQNLASRKISENPSEQLITVIKELISLQDGKRIVSDKLRRYANNPSEGYWSDARESIQVVTETLKKLYETIDKYDGELIYEEIETYRKLRNLLFARSELMSMIPDKPPNTEASTTQLRKIADDLDRLQSIAIQTQDALAEYLRTTKDGSVKQNVSLQKVDICSYAKTVFPLLEQSELKTLTVISSKNNGTYIQEKPVGADACWYYLGTSFRLTSPHDVLSCNWKNLDRNLNREGFNDLKREIESCFPSYSKMNKDYGGYVYLGSNRRIDLSEGEYQGKFSVTVRVGIKSE